MDLMLVLWHLKIRIECKNVLTVCGILCIIYLKTIHAPNKMLYINYLFTICILVVVLMGRYIMHIIGSSLLVT